MSSETERPTPLPGTAPSGARILARSFYRELRSNGYSPTELVTLATEIIGLINADLESGREVRSAA
jgi:hypothetical protein